MNFINSANPLEGTKDLSDKLAALLKEGKKVLWLLPGGTNIPISFAAMDTLINDIKDPELLSNLTVAQVDERYGVVGHVDSNWKQLMDLGFNTNGIQTIPVLTGADIEATSNTYAEKISKAFEDADVIIGQFGIGADGHIAGILPGSSAVHCTSPVCAYHLGAYSRITLTRHMLEQIDYAFVFAFGTSKKEAMENLKSGKLSFDEQPSSILSQIPSVNVYTDQV